MKLAHGLKRSLVQGAFWSVGTRWSIKALGFLSTVIMARLLMPSDYGIVAMAMLVVGLTQTLLDFSAATALLRKTHITLDEINSAWTLRLMQGCFVGLILLSIASLAAHLFKEPRVEAVLWVLAICVAVSGAGSMGSTLAQKSFNFALDFQLNIAGKVLGVLATVAAGFLLGDYRALVIGIATGYIGGFFLSYLMHPYRPRWCTRQIPQIWAVTKWLMLAGVGGFFLRKSDELIAARIGTTGEFGLYNVGADLGQLPTGELGPAMLRAFLPVLSSIQDDITRTNQAVLKTLAAVNTITMPVGIGFAAIALPATELLLGQQWIQAAPFVALFAWAGMLQFAMSPLVTLLVLRGHTRLQSQIVWAEFAVFVGFCFLLVPQLHLIGLVWARIAASSANALITILCARSYCHIPVVAVGQSLLRPLVGALVMFGVVHHTQAIISGSLWQLVVGIASGALVYTVWTLATWLVAGKPEGLESTVYEYFKKS